MIVLGLNAFGHDAAAVLLGGGRVLYASSEERFDRQRHSAAFPTRAIAAALAHADLRPSDVDAIAFPWSRGMARWTKLGYWLRHLPRSMAYLREPPDTQLPSRQGYLKAMAGIGARLASEGFKAPLSRVAHHRAHAASAALALPGGRGGILTADGMGEWTTAATWLGAPGSLRRLNRAVYPESPGKVYSAVTSWLGFRPESGEGKTMGLAAYGDPSAAGALFARSLLAPHTRGLVRVRRRALGFPWGEARLYGDAFLEALGPARRPGESLRETDADAARGIQDAVEAFALKAASDLLRESRASDLALAGGLFLNCAMNGRLQRELTAGVHPFPVAGDAGAAWGAAALVYEKASGRQAEPLGTLRLGHDLGAAECRAVAESLRARLYEDEQALATAVAARLAGQRILAVARGRAEFGPRALGARSLMASPTSRAMRDRVNALKGREAWRPLAPIVRQGDVTWFHDLVPSPHMILTFYATERARREIPGVMHEDGTARVQTVGPEDDRFTGALLSALAARGEPDVVINTSLNRRGEPIVNTAQQAADAAEAMDLDGLVLGNWIWDRRPFGNDS